MFIFKKIANDKKEKDFRCPHCKHTSAIAERKNNRWLYTCGKCNRTYDGSELEESEKEIDSERFSYRLSYLCPQGHLVLGADV